MEHFLFISILLLCITSANGVITWADCGIPLTRQINYQSVTLSSATSPINIATKSSDRNININVNVNLLQTLTVGGIQVEVQVFKDGATYLDVPVGDLCSILQSANQISCPLQPGPYSFSYLWELPPLPTGDYTVKIISSDTLSGTQTGCLSVETPLTGLGLDSCNYMSYISAELAGTAQYGVNTIQIGPWGTNGDDLPYDWGTFVNVDASADLVGYATTGFDNYVWGITGAINTNISASLFQGTVVVGYRSNITGLENAQLVYQGIFSWQMTKTSTNPPYIFQSGTFNFIPQYFYPTGFPYPLNFGNLNPFVVTQSADGSYFSVQASTTWCRCNCGSGGVGNEQGTPQSGSSGISDYKKAAIVVGVVGGAFIVVAVIFLVIMAKGSSKPVVYDDNDLMDPQKPDYGTLAINEIFATDERDFE
jgi:hypothetical protein